MRTRSYLVIITVLAVLVVFFSYMALLYAYVTFGQPPQEELQVYSYRVQICEHQQQLGYERCEVDGMTLDFDEAERAFRP